jgi:hypothetical protein
MGLFKQLMIFGKTGRGYWGPPIHNIGFCSRLGENPNTWKHFGPEPTQE